MANSVSQAALFCALLIAVAVIDAKSKTIPDSICILLALAGLIVFSPVKLLGLLIALPLLIAGMLCPGRIGGGDIKLTAAAGLTLGFYNGLTGLIVGFTAAILCYAVTQIGRTLRGQKALPTKQIALPLAPFLAIGFIAAHLINFNFGG